MHTRYVVPAVAVPAIVFAVGSACPVSAASTTDVVSATATGVVAGAAGVANEASTIAADTAATATGAAVDPAQPPDGAATRVASAATTAADPATQPARKTLDAVTPAIEVAGRVAPSTLAVGTAATDGATDLVPSATDTTPRTVDAAVAVVSPNNIAIEGVVAIATDAGASQPLGPIAASSSPAPIGNGPAATAGASTPTSPPTAALPTGPVVPTGPGVAGPAVLSISVAISPPIRPPVLVAGVTTPASMVTAPNRALPAIVERASGVDPSNRWELPRLDPVRIVDRDAAQPGSSTRAREATALHERFFGWFGKFMAFTGADVLRLVAVAVGLMMWGTVMLGAGRRLRGSR